MKRVEILVPMSIQVPEGLTPVQEFDKIIYMLEELQGSGNTQNAKLIDIDFFGYKEKEPFIVLGEAFRPQTHASKR